MKIRNPAFKSIVRWILVVAFVVVGLAGSLVGALYVAGLKGLSVSALRVIWYAATPPLLVVWGILLAGGKPAAWSAGWLTWALNLAAGFLFLPFAQPFVELARPLPGGGLILVHGLNLFLVLLAGWTLPEADEQRVQRRRRALASAVALFAAVMLMVSVAAWVFSSSQHRKLLGEMANANLMHLQLDIVHIDRGRFSWRMYDIRYSRPEPFRIEALGGMPIGTDRHQMTPLAYSWTGGDFTVGYAYQLIRYRRDLAFELAAPLWAPALLSLFMLAGSAMVLRKPSPLPLPEATLVGDAEARGSA